MSNSNVHDVTLLNDLIDHLGHNHFGHSLLFFHAPWAEQCRAMDGAITELAKAASGCQFWRISAEDFPEIAAQYEVKAVPCCVLVGTGGKVMGRVDGVKPAELTKMVLSCANSNNAPEKEGVTLDERCRQLISQKPLMLFIKGSPEEPRCGFTVQLLALLKKEGIREFGTFNILADEAVRQHLKTMSQWPTYPQIYWHGELLGGLDILKEMADGSLLGDIKRECA